MADTSCALQIESVVSNLEAGGRPFPMFFSDKLCQGEIWPPSEDEQKYANERTVQIDKLTFCNGNDFANCIPGFQSGIIPTGTRVIFTPNAASVVSERVFEMGQYDFLVSSGSSTAQGAVTAATNIWTLDVNGQKANPEGRTGTLKWHGADAGGSPTECKALVPLTVPECDEGKDEEKAYWSVGGPEVPDDSGGTKQGGLMNYSLFSCGFSWWPSFGAFTVDSGDFEFQRSGTTWTREDNQCLNVPGQVARATWGYSYSYETGCIFDNNCQPGVNNPGCGRVGTPYTTSECLVDTRPMLNDDSGITTLDGGFCGISTSNDPNSEGCQTCCTCCGVTDDSNDCNTSGTGLPTTCANPAQGSIGSATFTREKAWEDLQIEACVSGNYSIAGIRIQRYDQGTPACDAIMTDLCDNATLVNNNPTYKKACACILAKKRLQAKFVGLNLPVSCFAEECLQSDPGVYKTATQKRGCSARLCQQTLAIDGDAIAFEGYQEIRCNGTLYNVSDQTVAGSPVPQTSLAQEPGVKLGVIFYLSLGLLVVALTLVIAWVVRRVVVRRRARKATQAAIASSLEATLGAGAGAEKA